RGGVPGDGRGRQGLLQHSHEQLPGRRDARLPGAVQPGADGQDHLVAGEGSLPVAVTAATKQARRAALRACSVAGRAYCALSASTFSTIVTLSSTITPPLSSVLFQLMPQSLRFTVVVAAKPALLPHDWPSTLTADEPRNSASNVTDLVTPRMVRSPVILYLFLPLFTIFVLLKDRIGFFSPSKKSELWRWPSRFWLPVSTLATFTVASIFDAVGLASS